MRAVVLGLALAAAGCSSSSSRPAPVDPIPVTSAVTTVASTVVPSTVVATTTSLPFVAPKVLVNPKVVVQLGPGVTVEDQRAAEAAAINWWIELDRQSGNLPNYDQAAILALAYPNQPAGPDAIELFEALKSRGARTVQGSINQLQINIVAFQNPAEVQMQVCVANNGYVVDALGNPENTDLVAYYTATYLKRYAGRWLVVDYGNNRPKQVGKTCADLP